DAAATDMATERPMSKALLARSIVAGVVTALALVWLRSRPAPRGADAREVSLVEDLEVTLSDPAFTFGLDDGQFSGARCGPNGGKHDSEMRARRAYGSARACPTGHLGSGAGAAWARVAGTDARPRNRFGSR